MICVVAKQCLTREHLLGTALAKPLCAGDVRMQAQTKPSGVCERSGLTFTRRVRRPPSTPSPRTTTIFRSLLPHFPLYTPLTFLTPVLHLIQSVQGFVSGSTEFKGQATRNGSYLLRGSHGSSNTSEDVVVGPLVGFLASPQRFLVVVQESRLFVWG